MTQRQSLSKHAILKLQLMLQVSQHTNWSPNDFTSLSNSLPLSSTSSHFSWDDSQFWIFSRSISLYLNNLITTAELFCLFTCSWPSCQVSCHETGTRVTTRGNWLVRNSQVVLEFNYNNYIRLRYLHIIILPGLKKSTVPLSQTSGFFFLSSDVSFSLAWWAWAQASYLSIKSLKEQMYM